MISVGAARLELTTPGFGGRYSIQMSYAPEVSWVDRETGGEEYSFLPGPQGEGGGGAFFEGRGLPGVTFFG
jgi:hypothetical protein